MWKTLIAAALAAAPLLAAAAAAAAAEDGAEGGAHPHLRLWQAEGAYEDVVLDVKLAVEGRGLVVDHVSHVGDMLNRTAGDLGAGTAIYEGAEVIQFCSAAASRAVMEADALNIAWCPYGIFVMQKAGSDTVLVGFRRMPEGAMQRIEALLAGIVEEATEF